MRSLLTKLTAVAVAAFMMLSFVAAPAASAQTTYPPTLPGPSGLPSAEVVSVIQGNAAAAAAQAAAAAGDFAGAQAAADTAAALVAQARAAGFSAQTIAALQAAANAAAASASVPAAPPINIPAAPPINLAFTGADVNVPLAAGAIMVGAGGLVLLAARKREQNA